MIRSHAFVDILEREGYTSCKKRDNLKKLVSESIRDFTFCRLKLFILMISKVVKALTEFTGILEPEIKSKLPKGKGACIV